MSKIKDIWNDPAGHFSELIGFFLACWAAILAVAGLMLLVKVLSLI